MIKKFYAILIHLIFFFLINNAQIAVDFKADTTIACPGYAIKFTDLSVGDTVYNWHWDFGDGFNLSNVQNPIHSYTAPGIYTVSLTASSSNDTKTKTKNNYIIIRDFPQSQITYLDTLFLPSYLIYFKGQILNNDGYFYHYYWNFDNTAFTKLDSVVIHLFNKEGQHNVQLMIKAGAGCIDTSSIDILVKDTLIAPNIFTPNDDGYNDIFIVKTNGYNDFTLDIFNRWGAIVYSVTCKRPQWDGYSSAGIKLPPGIYYYHVTSPDIKGYKLSGKILLIR